MQYLLILDN